MKAKSVSVVLPAYNEALNIAGELGDIFDFLKDNFNEFEIIVVDDGSKDQTYSICSSVRRELGKSIIVLKHEHNKGYGAALRTGLFSAKNDLIFYTDSDNQFDIRELLEFTKVIDNYDLVIGYRLGRQDAAIRKFTSVVYKLLIRTVFGLKVRDIDCSFKLFKRECLERLSIERDNFFVDTELLLKAKLNNCKLKEIGVRHLPRKFGRSTIRFWHIFATLSDILYFWPKLKRSRYGSNKEA